MATVGRLLLWTDETGLRKIRESPRRRFYKGVRKWIVTTSLVHAIAAIKIVMRGKLRTAASCADG
nr:MAG TPA: hypothetical protein [Caudoviricetes sp.]